MRNTVERDTATNNVRVAAQSFSPASLRHDCHVSGFLFIREKGAAADRTHPEGIEVIWGDAPAVNQDRIAHAGPSKRRPVVGGEA